MPAVTDSFSSSRRRLLVAVSPFIGEDSATGTDEADSTRGGAALLIGLVLLLVLFECDCLGGEGDGDKEVFDAAFRSCRRWALLLRRSLLTSSWGT